MTSPQTSYTTDKLVSTTQQIGIYSAKFQLVSSVIIGLVFIAIGLYYLIDNPDKETIQLDAIITTSNCTKSIRESYNQNSRRTYENYKCVLVVTYTIDEKEYTTTINTDSATNYSVDQVIKIRVQKGNYYKADIDNTLPSYSGYIMSCIGITIIGFGFLHLWAVNKWPWYATMSGINTTANIFFN
jgi:hypothetical protein